MPVTEPVQFTSDVDQTGQYWGIGITGTAGIKHNWLAVDVNWTWTDLEKLDVPVRGRVLGLRYGRTIKLNAKSRANWWIGANNQKFATATDGSIALNEAIPPDVADSLQNAFANYQNSPWYQALGLLGSARRIRWWPGSRLAISGQPWSTTTSIKPRPIHGT